MIRSLTALTGFEALARDGETGKIKDFLFDDRHWGIRYLVVRAGSWLTGREFLLSPEAVGEPEWETRRLAVDLSREQIRNSPPLTADPPVSRRKAADLHRYYDWNDPGWYAAQPHFAVPPAPLPEEPAGEGEDGDPHLRSAREVAGYGLQAADGGIGHLEDLLADTEQWAVRYLVADTRNWWPGKKVLLAPAAIVRIDWAERRLHLSLTRNQVRESPEYDPAKPLGREYETRLYDYYGWPKYWV